MILKLVNTHYFTKYLYTVAFFTELKFDIFKEGHVGKYLDNKNIFNVYYEDSMIRKSTITIVLT